MKISSLIVGAIAVAAIGGPIVACTGADKPTVTDDKVTAAFAPQVNAQQPGVAVKCHGQAVDGNGFGTYRCDLAATADQVGTFTTHATLTVSPTSSDPSGWTWQVTGSE